MYVTEYKEHATAQHATYDKYLEHALTCDGCKVCNVLQKRAADTALAASIAYGAKGTRI